jgi:hypothetical protein
MARFGNCDLWLAGLLLSEIARGPYLAFDAAFGQCPCNNRIRRMPSRFLHQVVSLVLVVIAALDFAVPCCATEDSFPVGTAAISSSVQQPELNIGAAEKSPARPDCRYACDNCYGCSSFTNTSFQLGDPVLETLARNLALRPQHPPTTPLQSLYRPPRA